jgi:hypothetical protein
MRAALLLLVQAWLDLDAKGENAQCHRIGIGTHQSPCFGAPNAKFRSTASVPFDSVTSGNGAKKICCVCKTRVNVVHCV